MNQKKTSYKTIIISDLHLGTKNCKAKELLDFLDTYSFEKLILNGDVIDSWSLKRQGGWEELHSKVLNKILEYIDDEKTEVIFIKGNHDEKLEEVLDFPIEKFDIKLEHIHENINGNYFITHGDRFDSINQNHKWLAQLGDIAYHIMMGINKIYNSYRSWRGKKYYSISKAAKAFVKSIVSSNDQFNKKLVKAAKEKGCCGIMCGHIHTAQDALVEGIHYLNSGDWVESLTAITEDHDGNLQLLSYQEELNDLS